VPAQSYPVFEKRNDLTNPERHKKKKTFDSATISRRNNSVVINHVE